MPINRSNLFELQWPFKGLHEATAYAAQDRETTASAQNVRPWDPASGRMRGSQRAGLTKYLTAAASANPVQCLTHLVAPSAAAPTASAVTNRSVTALAVVGGSVYTFTTSAFTLPTGGNALASAAPQIFATQFATASGQGIFFADGSNYAYYDSSDGQVKSWSATNGTIPANGSLKPRLITTWNGRVVLSGLPGDRQNWFMSGQLDAFEWDYNPNPSLTTQAVAGNNSRAGKVGDIINSMVPFTDDNMLFLCDHTIWQMSGNPNAGGRIDLISDITGGAFGQNAWAKTPDGAVYFFGSRGGVYRITPGSVPEEISHQIEESLATVNLDTHVINMAWDDRQEGLHVFISPLTAAASTHWYWDARTDSWWKDVFADNDFNPLAVNQFDGDAAADRVLMLGGMDGRVRYFQLTGTADDGSAIDSFIFLGPLKGSHRQRIILNEVQVTLADGSSDVTMTYHRGEDAQSAIGAAACHTRTLSAGRGYSSRDRLAGHDIYIKLQNNTLSETWSLEEVRAQMELVSGPAQRIF